MFGRKIFCYPLFHRKKYFKYVIKYLNLNLETVILLNIVLICFSDLLVFLFQTKLGWKVTWSSCKVVNSKIKNGFFNTQDFHLTPEESY